MFFYVFHWSSSMISVHHCHCHRLAASSETVSLSLSQCHPLRLMALQDSQGSCSIRLLRNYSRKLWVTLCGVAAGCSGQLHLRGQWLDFPGVPPGAQPLLPVRGGSCGTAHPLPPSPPLPSPPCCPPAISLLEIYASYNWSFWGSEPNWDSAEFISQSWSFGSSFRMRGHVRARPQACTVAPLWVCSCRAEAQGRPHTGWRDDLTFSVSLATWTFYTQWFSSSNLSDSHH